MFADSSENEDDHFSDASEGDLRRASVGSGHYGFDAEEQTASAGDGPGTHHRKPSVEGMFLKY